jgi:hypothetical protein
MRVTDVQIADNYRLGKLRVFGAFLHRSSRGELLGYPEGGRKAGYSGVKKGASRNLPRPLSAVRIPVKEKWYKEFPIHARFGFPIIKTVQYDFSSDCRGSCHALLPIFNELHTKSRIENWVVGVRKWQLDPAVDYGGKGEDPDPDAVDFFWNKKKEFIHIKKG